MRIKRYLSIFLVALVSVFALGLANKEVRAEIITHEVTIKTSGSYSSGIGDGDSIMDQLNITGTTNGIDDVKYIRNNTGTHSIFNNSSEEIRLYPGSGNGGEVVISIKEAEYKITKVTVNTSQNPGSSLSINADEGNSGSSVTKEFIEDTFKVSLKNINSNSTGSGNQLRVKSIIIEYVSTVELGPDETAPEILGHRDLDVYVNSTTHDWLEGITAQDDRDGDITNKIIVDDSLVDLTKIGTYPLTYTVSDEAENTEIVTVNVNVLNPNAPVDKVNVKVVSSFDNENQTEVEFEKIYGEKIEVTLTALPEYEFAHWLVNGSFRDYPINHTFTVTSKLELVAVFKPVDTNAVTFIDSNNNWIDTVYVDDTNEFAEPTTNHLSKPGYTIPNDETKWTAILGSEDLENITEDSVFQLNYVLDETVETVLISVIGGMGEGNYEFNSIVSVVATTPGFTHWEEDGEVVSFNETYKFSALEDREIVAVAGELESENLVTINEVFLRDGYRSFLGQFELLPNAEIIEYGFIFKDSLEELTFETQNVVIAKSGNHQPLTNEFLMSFPEGILNSVRSYVVIKDNGLERVLYSVQTLIGEEGLVWLTENFEDSNLTSSYLNGSFMDANGVVWNYGYARNEGDYPIEGKGILLNNAAESYLEVTFTNGIGQFYFEYRKAFTGAQDRELEVLVDGIQVATTPTFGGTLSAEETNVYSILVPVNVKGQVTIKIKNVGNTTTTRHVVIDNIKWTENIGELFTVDFDLNGGEGSVNSQDVYERNLVDKPVDPTREGYIFDGWKLDSTVFDFDKDLVESNITLVAQWIEIVYYSVDFDVNFPGESAIDNPTAQTIESGNKIVKPVIATEMDGYVFRGWTLDPNVSDVIYWDFDTEVFENITTLYGHWTEQVEEVFATDLFISEYIEGSSNNKAIEIYNGTGEDVNLSNYQLRLFANGASSTNSTLTLSGTLKHGEVYVIVNNQANNNYKTKANITNGTVTAFNGDDALGLYKNNVLIDTFLTIGLRQNIAADMTLVRKSHITGPSETFNMEDWIKYPIDTITYLGSHVMDPQ